MILVNFAELSSLYRVWTSASPVFLLRLKRTSMPRPSFTSLLEGGFSQSLSGQGFYATALCWSWGAALVALAWAAPGLAQTSSTVESTTIIIRSPIPRPPIVWPYPYPVPDTNTVRVEFDALGTDWGAVYLDGRLIYRPHNFDRQKTIYLPPGGYRLEITGVVRSDRWASGYLDLGRDNSRLAVIRFSKTGGVAVSGGPYVWIED
ncbi:MAG: hypothetical protein HC922_07960 [Leptolyngbyaceae cyanobacterium SM2_3_12]|nr:hypothetical protein [Leptolyngbyaceae cyanobacterium SM2_3_12]